MKLRIFESTWRGGSCLKGIAVIGKSKKLGIPKRVQKSWIARGEVFHVKLEEVEASFKAAAAKWEAETLDRIKNGQPPQPRQEEIEV